MVAGQTDWLYYYLLCQLPKPIGHYLMNEACLLSSVYRKRIIVVDKPEFTINELFQMHVLYTFMHLCVFKNVSTIF